MDPANKADPEKALFEQALDLASDAERNAFLKGACGENAALLARVQALLKAHESGAGFLPEQPQTQPPLGPVSERSGTLIGRYKLLERIGEGGYGLVYVAEQREPVKRQVALKIIKLGMDTKEVVARFESERQALAMMNHPNIARVFDGGATNAGRPFFAMELVRGVRITEYSDQHQLPTEERLKLFIQVCRALQHAHQKGVIHRDIKPSNILVMQADDVAVPKVIDFGIAKAIGERLTDKTIHTRFEEFIGTPAYMSPEQAGLSGLDVDTRSDIYALGVLLYELLTGQAPFESKELPRAGLDKILRRIREEEPPKPSTRLSRLGLKEQTTMAQRRATEALKLIRSLQGDLDWIVMKCLEKNRARRYETANELARDIECHLNHQPVAAGPPSALYNLQKFVVRNKWPVILNATVAMLTIAGLIGTSIGLKRATVARIQADQNADAATKSTLAAQVAETNALRLAYSASMLLASDAIESQEIDSARHFLDSAPAALRGWEWRHLASRLDLSTRFHPHPRPAWNSQIQVSADGRSYYDFANEPTPGIRRYDMETGQLLGTIPTSNRCSRTWFVAGGKKLVTQAETEGGQRSIEVWDLDRGTRLSSQSVQELGQAATDGSLFAYYWDQRIHIMDTSTGTTRATRKAVIAGLAGESTASLCFQPDGRRLAIYDYPSRRVALLDTDSLEILTTFEPDTNQIWTLAFSPDSRLLATGSTDSTIRIIDVSANPPTTVVALTYHAGFIWGLCFSPDGRLLATSGLDHTVRLWDTRTGASRGVFESNGTHPSFLPDGQTLINYDTTGVHFWDVRSADAWVLRGHKSYVYPVLFSPDGTTIYSGGWDGYVGQPGSLRFWDAATSDLIAAAGTAGAFIRGTALSPDGSRLAISIVAWNYEFERIEILDAATGITQARVTNACALDSLAFDPSGENIAWVNHLDGIAHIADARTGEIRVSRKAFEGVVNYYGCQVAWSPDGSTIAVYDLYEPTLELLDGKTLKTVRSWPHGHKGTITSVAYSPDGRHILTASEDGTVRVWNSATGTLLHELVGHGNRVFCAVYSPDGKRIATGGNDGNVRIWDGATFDQVARLGGHADYVYKLAWRADSQQLISSSGDRTLHVWDTQPLKDRLQARRERQAILAQVEPIVQRLFAEIGEAGKVVAQIKADGALTARARQVALQVVLRISLERQSAAAPTAHR